MEPKLHLTREQREAFFSRDRSVPWPKLAGDGPPPIERGYVHRLSSRLSIEVTKVSRTKRGGWEAEYRIYDDREERFYLLPTARTLPVDERGNVTPMAPEEEIGYTRNPRKGRADQVPSVPPDLQNVYSMQAKLRQAERPISDSEWRSQSRSVREQLHQAMNQLGSAGQTALLARIKRDIEEAIENEREAA